MVDLSMGATIQQLDQPSEPDFVQVPIFSNCSLMFYPFLMLDVELHGSLLFGCHDFFSLR